MKNKNLDNKEKEIGGMKITNIGKDIIVEYSVPVRRENYSEFIDSIMKQFRSNNDELLPYNLDIKNYEK